MKTKYQSTCWLVAIAAATVVPLSASAQQLEEIIVTATHREVSLQDGSNGEQVPTFPTYIHNTEPGSIAALPGISLPVGLTAEGLPVAIEIDGPENSDRQLLAIATILEQIFANSARPQSRE